MNNKFKKNILYTIIIILSALLVYFGYKTIHENNLKSSNSTLYKNEITKLTPTDFQYDTSYVLFSTTNYDNNISYLGRIENTKVTKLYKLDHYYEVISYNQEEKRIELYSKNKCLYFSQYTLIENDYKESLFDKIEYESQLKFDFPFMEIYSHYTALYNTVGYTQRIYMNGFENLIPIGTVFTHTVVRYS